jgi:hypothetical protein
MYGNNALFNESFLKGENSCYKIVDKEEMTPTIAYQICELTEQRLGHISCLTCEMFMVFGRRLWHLSGLQTSFLG